MRVKPEVVDESNDRKYFSIVPNYITNHSSYLEQGVYLTMKRIAGETGICFASQKELAKRGGISQQTVSRVISKLISRGWVKEDGFQPGKTKPVKRWRIVDLWRLNLDYYDNPKEEIVTLVSKSFDTVSPSLNNDDDKSSKKVRLSHQPKKIDNQRSEYKIVNVVSKEEETIEEDKTKTIVKTKVLTSKIDILPEKKINELISLFEPLNPSYKEMFKNKTQRAALLRLTTQHGEEKVAQMIKMLPKIIAQPYAPRITSPYQLEMKLGELRIFMAQKKNKGNERRVVNGRGLN